MTSSTTPPPPPDGDAPMPSPGQTAPCTDQAAQEMPVLELIRQIQDRTVSGRAITAADRRRCVEYLLEQYTIMEIAKIFGVSERTVYNDLKAIRKSNALQPNEHFSAEFAGEMIHEARIAIGNLRRLAREKGVDPGVKVQAYRQAFDVFDMLANRLQRLGFLPSAVQRSELSVDLHEPPKFEELQEEAKRLMVIVEQSTIRDPALIEQIQRTEQLVDRSVIHQQIGHIHRSMEGVMHES